MGFTPKVKEEVLWNSRRCCAVCREFAGRDNEVHHIIPEADGGPNTIDNAINLCSRCHIEASHYDARQPKGTKYSPDELRRFRDELWQAAEEKRHLILTRGNVSVNPAVIETTILNLDAKQTVSVTNSNPQPLYNVQASLTISQGTLTTKDLDIEARSLGEEMVKLPGGAEMYTNVAILYGKDDVGRELAVIDVRELAPFSQALIDVLVPGGKPAEIVVMLDNYDAETESILKDETSVFRPLRVARDMSIERVAAYLDTPDGIEADVGIFRQ